MLQSELLTRLRQEISAAEWADMAAGRLVISDHNRTALMEMRELALAGDAQVNDKQVDSLDAALKGYLSAHMADKPEGWKWIRLACQYLAFIARRPLHPAEKLGIRETTRPDGRAVYECPEKSPDPKAVCRWCVCRRMSNYDIMKRRMQSEFVRFDQDAMIEKFGLRADADAICLRFVGREYRISRADGAVVWSADGFETTREADYNEAMTIYDVLCYSKPGCRASGRFVNMSALSSIQGGSVTSNGSMLRSAVDALDRHRDRIAEACERLGGVPDEKGDVSYRLPMFDFLPIILRFWASDEEFPASLDIFLDANMLDFMHYETVWFAVIHAISRVREEMGA